MVDLEVVTLTVIFAGLTGAIVWDLVTWYYGLPTSSSHALFGGYAGAAVAKAGFIAIIPSGWTRTIIFIVLAPLIGLVVGLVLMTLSQWVLQRQTPRRVDGFFRKMQLVSAAAFSLMHGANDAQKTMGIIAGALVTGGFLDRGPDGALPIPYWVILLANGAIALGHTVRRLAHHQDDGREDHEAATDRRVRGRDWRGARDLLGYSAWRRHQHHSHDHRRHRRGRLFEAPVRSSLGRCPSDRLGLGPDDSRIRLHRWPDLRNLSTAVLGALNDAPHPAAM